MEGIVRLQQVLDTFKIGAKVTSFREGPRYTRYYVELVTAQKTNQLKNLAIDIGKSFGIGNNVLIDLVVGEKDTVSIDIPACFKSS